MAGGTSTCDTSIKKFVKPFRLAKCTAIALAGAVVSKPMPKKTTLRSGFCSAIRTLSRCGADVLAHNVETVRRLNPSVRDPRCDYDQSLQVLRSFKREAPGVLTKSSLMLGLGETNDEARETIRDLREHGVELLTIGQYLPPDANYLPLDRYVTPAEFDELGAFARELGFARVESAPLVRSSYHAEDAPVATAR